MSFFNLESKSTLNIRNFEISEYRSFQILYPTPYWVYTIGASIYVYAMGYHYLWPLWKRREVVESPAAAAAEAEAEEACMLYVVRVTTTRVRSKYSVEALSVRPLNLRTDWVWLDRNSQHPLDTRVWPLLLLFHLLHTHTSKPA